MAATSGAMATTAPSADCRNTRCKAYCAMVKLGSRVVAVVRYSMAPSTSRWTRSRKTPLKKASTAAAFSESRECKGKSSTPSRTGISRALFTGPDISSTSASRSVPSWKVSPASDPLPALYTLRLMRKSSSTRSISPTAMKPAYDSRASSRLRVSGAVVKSSNPRSFTYADL